MDAACLVRLASRSRLLAAVCLVSLLGVCATARAAEVGLNSDITWGIPSSAVSQEIQATTGAGVPWIRATIDLSGAAYYGPQLNMSYLSQIDSAVEAARSAGLQVLLELDRAPYWASADPQKYVDSSGNEHWNPYYRYANAQDYATIVSAVVAHYAAMGVHAYEVWNEPNNPSFWPSGPSASQYVALLKAAYPAIKAADPSATVVMGGLENDGPDDAYQYLQAMYAAGARGYYDVANFHIYPGGSPTQCPTDSAGRPADDTFCLLSGLRSEMTANGDTSPAWVTELGWSTCSQSWCVTPQEQASYITSAFNLLATSQYAWVQKAFIYQTRDLYTDTSNTAWDSSLGIMTRTFAPKPAYAAVQALTSAPPSQTTTPAAGQGPTVTVSAPAPGAVIAKQLTVSATVSDTAAIKKVTIAVDGAVKATLTSSPYTATISTKSLANGTHTLAVTAYDVDGRQGSAAVPLVKGSSVAARSLARSAAAARGGETMAMTAKARHRRVTISGRLRGLSASGRRVLLVLQRRAGGRWAVVKRIRVVLREGRYSCHVRLRPGLWRVSGEYGRARTTRVVSVH